VTGRRSNSYRRGSSSRSRKEKKERKNVTGRRSNSYRRARRSSARGAAGAGPAAGAAGAPGTAAEEPVVRGTARATTTQSAPASAANTTRA